MPTRFRKNVEQNDAPNPQIKAKSQSQVNLPIQFVDNRSETVIQKTLQAMSVRDQNSLNTRWDNRSKKTGLGNGVSQLKKSGEEHVGLSHLPIGTNNTGLPDQLKSGVENLSGYSMDDVNVHFNSTKPAQIQAHAFAQGTDIHLASGQEKHLPHEAWHVVQQKQGRVKPTLKMKEAYDFEYLSPSKVKENPLALKSKDAIPTNLFTKVIQRQILVDGDVITKDDTLDEIVVHTKGDLQNWFTKKGMTATLGASKHNLKNEVDATKSNNKVNKYLIANHRSKMEELLVKYDQENRSFPSFDELLRQVIQDFKLMVLRMDDFIGIDHHNGQYSQTNKSSGDKPLRIYRTTTREDWNNYLISKDVKGLLHGHGGAFGQALDYYYKSKNSEESGPLYDNVIFEITLNRTATHAIDYTEISSGGEGGGPSGGKLTGKSEKNDILGEENIFSVNLGASKDLIISMNPIVRRVDEMKGEDSQYSKRLLEFALKHGEYPPKNLTENERDELNQLRDI